MRRENTGAPAGEAAGALPVNGTMEPDQDLIAAGYLGLSGTACAVLLQTDRLRRQFSEPFLRECGAVRERWGVRADPELFLAAGAASWCAAGEGGVFAALWHYFEAFGLGFDLELRRLPIRQETVEICEALDLNPYRLQSEGLVLFTSPCGGRAVRFLREKGVFARIIGNTRRQIGRHIYNGDGAGFLERPAPDELLCLKQAAGSESRDDLRQIQPVGGRYEG